MIFVLYLVIVLFLSGVFMLNIDFSKKTILVTGASSGIGRATATTLSQLGARVVLSGRNDEALRETLNLMVGEGHNLAPFDLAQDCEKIPSWLKTIAAEHGLLSGLVHCAGVEETVPLRQVDHMMFDRVLRINTEAALFLVKGISQKKCHVPPCSIVLISSVAGLTGQAARSVYCASKGALNAMTKSLAVELARKNIRVNTVCPGQVETEMGANIKSKVGENQYQAIVDAHPLGLGKPEDVAMSVSFLLSDAARWVTGTSLVVDGGYTSI